MIAPLIGRYLNMIRTLLFSTELFDRINLVVKSHNRRSGSGILMPWAPGPLGVCSVDSTLFISGLTPVCDVDFISLQN